MTSGQQLGHGTGKLCCAFVGCGAITQQYLSVYRDLGWVSVRACVDIDVTRAQWVADRLALSEDQPIIVSDKLCAALAPEIDIVVVGTPNDLHREHALGALALGKHVLLQKPLAATLEDGQAIADAAIRSTGTTGVYMSYFDRSLVHDLRGMVARNLFGEITQIHARLMHPLGLVWSQQAVEGSGSWRGSLRRTGGGAFIQLAVHYIRLLHWILDEPIVSVQGLAANRLCSGLEGEDSSAAILQLASGIYVTMNMSWCSSGEELSIHGTEGGFVYQDNRWVTIRARESYRGHSVDYKAGEVLNAECIPPSLGDASHPFNQHRMFLEAIFNGTAPFVSVEDALKDLAVVSAFYTSVRTGAIVRLPLTEKPV